MHYKDVIADMLKPKDKLGSVIDTFIVLGEILEAREKTKKGEYFDVEDIDVIIINSMYKLGFFPFWNAHGAVLRPLWLQAIQSENDDVIVKFFSEAIPCALTIAMPHTQLEYPKIREKVIQKFKE